MSSLMQTTNTIENIHNNKRKKYKRAIMKNKCGEFNRHVNQIPAI